MLDLAELWLSDPLRVVWLNEGKCTEDPWTLTHLIARDAVDRMFGARVHTTFVEKVPLGPTTHGIIDGVVSDGGSVVFATSAGFDPFIRDAAIRHPTVRFEQARGTQDAANVSTFTGAHEQPAFLMGMAAGTMTSSGILAYVLPVAEPETVRILNGFTRGVRLVRPDAMVLAGVSGTWWEPDRERAVGEVLLDLGADVLATGCTSPGTARLALERHVPWCGQDVQRIAEYGDVWVSAACANWERYYSARVHAVLEGSWEGTSFYGTVADGFTDIAPLGQIVPSQARRLVMEARRRLLDGSFDVFVGPVWNRQLREVVPPGVAPTVAELLAMDWLIDGVEPVAALGEYWALD